MFWRVRSIVDEMSVSLAKEGYISAILVEAGPDGKLPFDLSAWEHDWMPVMVVQRQTGLVTHALSGETAGHLRHVSTTRLLAPTLGTPADSMGATTFGVPPEDDLFLGASDAFQVRKARRRYGFAMRALVVPPDPPAWATAACVGDMDADLAIEYGQRFSALM